MALKTEADVKRLGYVAAVPLSDGRWLAVGQSSHTYDLHIIESEFKWSEKWIFRRASQAFAALETFNGVGDPTGEWLRHKPSDRLNPQLLRESCAK